MRISRIEVSNFRAISNASIDLEPLTSIIGANNSGKSAFLKALDLFFSNAPRVDDEDFHNRNVEKPIDITLTFIELTPDEKKLFAANLLGDELVVTRHLLHGNSKGSGEFSVDALANLEFKQCRDEQGKTARRELYGQLREKYSELPAVKNADEIDERLEAWEASHPEALKRQRVGSFRGWKNVAVGQLKGRTDFVFVPAVRDAALETGEAKSPAKQLIDALAKQTIENNQEFQDFKIQTNERLRQFTDPNNVPALVEISEALSILLRQYYSESELIATWEPISEFPIPFPSAEIAVRDHGFLSGVERVGHGLQRAAIIAILEYLAREKFKNTADDANEFTEPLSDIIIAIEEPEIYQHPIKQRHIAKVLGSLTESFSRQTGIRLQVVLATHSPLFVHLPRFHEVRIIRRHVADPYPVRVSKLTISDCSRALANMQEPPREPMGDTAFAAKLHIFSSEVSEGFFAKKVVLVEGISDKAILEAMYSRNHRSPIAEGICIIDVGGKKKIDKPAFIFDAMNIPVFAIVDNDKTSTQDEVAEKRYNRLLQKILHVPEEQISDWPTSVMTHCAAWDGNLELYMIGKCGRAVYDEVKKEMMENFEVDNGDCVKSPTIAGAMLARFIDREIKFEELDAIIAAIDCVGM